MSNGKRKDVTRPDYLVTALSGGAIEFGITNTRCVVVTYTQTTTLQSRLVLTPAQTRRLRDALDVMADAAEMGL